MTNQPRKCFLSQQTVHWKVSLIDASWPLVGRKDYLDQKAFYDNLLALNHDSDNFSKTNVCIQYNLNSAVGFSKEHC